MSLALKTLEVRETWRPKFEQKFDDAENNWQMWLTTAQWQRITMLSN